MQRDCPYHRKFLSEFKIILCNIICAFLLILLLQWSYGVTCWEVFTCGKVPYVEVPTPTLVRQLRNGLRLERPQNIVCSDKMYVCSVQQWDISNPTTYHIQRKPAPLRRSARPCIIHMQTVGHFFEKYTHAHYRSTSPVDFKASEKRPSIDMDMQDILKERTGELSQQRFCSTCKLSFMTCSSLYRWSIMKRCWEEDHTERPSFASLTNILFELMSDDPAYVKLSTIPQAMIKHILCCIYLHFTSYYYYIIVVYKILRVF